MEIEFVEKKENVRTICKHEVGKVYLYNGEYYLCCYDPDCGYCMVNIRNGYFGTELANNLKDIDLQNPNDIEVSCKLVVEK